jgi:hypothetical protein
MRDKRFVAEHRGGPLKKEQHRQLINWACDCIENVFPLLGNNYDDRLKNALMVARAWAFDKTTVGDTRNASVNAIAVANESSDPVTIAVARAVGHAVATAHMADHSLGSAIYALKAVKSAGGSVDAEREWQNEHLPYEVRELILSIRSLKEQGFKDLREE